MLEADFVRYYQVDPLRIGWRQTLVLLRGLPADSVLVASLRALVNGDQDEDEPEMYRVLGRERPRQRMTLDDFVARGGHRA